MKLTTPLHEMEDKADWNVCVSKEKEIFDDEFDEMDGNENQNCLAPSTELDGGDGLPSVKSSITTRSERKRKKLIENKLRNLKDIASRINVSSIIMNKATILLDSASKNKTIKHRLTSHDATAAACIIIASREEGVPRTFKELCGVSNSSMKQISRHFKIIWNEFPTLTTGPAAISAEDLLPRFSSYINLPSNWYQAVVHLTREVKKLGMVMGRSPASVAAASIYAITQKGCFPTCVLQKLVDASGMKEDTIIQCYKILLPHVAPILSTYKFMLE